MSNRLRLTFLIHAIVGLVTGIPLLVVPGRFLELLGWQAMLESFNWGNTDPFATRLLGAAFLALAWSSFRGWRAKEKAEVVALVEMEAIFTVAGAAGMLRHLLGPLFVEAWFPAIGWFTVAILVLFAVAWIISLVNYYTQRSD